MSKYSIRQGETAILNLTVLDKTGNILLLDTSSVTNVIVTLENKGTIFARYSLVDMGVEYKGLSVTGNTIVLLAERSETKNWLTGIAKANVTIEYETVAIPNYVYDFSENDFLSIENSANKDIPLIHQ